MFTSCSNGKKFEFPESILNKLFGTYETSSENEPPLDNNISSSEIQSTSKSESNQNESKPVQTQCTTKVTESKSTSKSESGQNAPKPVQTQSTTQITESKSTEKSESSQNKPNPVQTQSTTKVTESKSTSKTVASQNAIKPAETAKPNPCANGHSWVAQTKTVHHDEAGHYETVVDAKKVTKYRCPLCGYGSDNEYSSLDAYYKHFDAKHGDDSLSSTFRDRYEEVERWEEYETEEWIVDSKAYDEKVITGYKCSVCGAKK